MLCARLWRNIWRIEKNNKEEAFSVVSEDGGGIDNKGKGDGQKWERI